MDALQVVGYSLADASRVVDRSVAQGAVVKRFELLGPPSWQRAMNDVLRRRGCRVLPLPRGWRLVLIAKPWRDL